MNNSISVAQTYTLELKQVAEVTTLKEILGLNASQVARLAIDTLYEKITAAEQEEKTAGEQPAA